MNFIERVAGVIVKPDSTMKDIIKEPRIEEPILILGAYTILMVLATYVSLSKTVYVGEISGVDASGFGTLIMLSSIAFAAIFIIIGWPLLTVIFHLISMFFGGDGKIYPNMLTGVGYMNVPQIIIGVLYLIVAFLQPSTVIDLGDPTAAAAATTSIYTVLSMAISAIGLLWGGYVAAQAVKHGEKLSMRNSIIVVFVPIVLYLLFTYASLILTLLMPTGA